jgi:hypothetical protein
MRSKIIAKRNFAGEQVKFGELYNKSAPEWKGVGVKYALQTPVEL